MKRLYNEYSAAPQTDENVQWLQSLAEDFAKAVWDNLVDYEDVCPRDVESLCHSTIASVFALNILQKAMKKVQRENHFKKLDKKE